MAAKSVDKPGVHALATRSTAGLADAALQKSSAAQIFRLGTCPRFGGRRLYLSMRQFISSHPGHARRRREHVVEVLAITLLDMLIHGIAPPAAVTLPERPRAGNPARAEVTP